jgi:hypothetical protein
MLVTMSLSSHSFDEGDDVVCEGVAWLRFGLNGLEKNRKDN